MDRYERQVLIRHVLVALSRRALGRSYRRRRPEVVMAKWLVEHTGDLGWKEQIVTEAGALDLSVGQTDRATWIALAPFVAHLRRPTPSTPPSGLQKRLDWLCALLELDAGDAEILCLAVRTVLTSTFRSLADAAIDGCSNRGEINQMSLCALLGRSPDAIRDRLRPSRTLRLLGLIQDTGGGDIAPTSSVLRVAELTYTRDDLLREALLGPAKPSELAWEEFEHLGELCGLAERVTAGALRCRERGVNLLLHGAPGTGKTEFALALAARVGARAVFVGEADHDDGEPNRLERIAAFAMARAMASRAGGTMLVVDEADDIFTGVDEDDGAARKGSKVFMNRLVETTAAPTVWITNHPERLGAAVMRRMSIAIRFAEPGRERRRVMIARMATRRRVRLPRAGLESIASIQAAPAVLDAGLRAARLTRGGAADAVLAARSVVRAMRGSAVAVANRAGDFDCDLSAADHNLTHLADRVAAAPGRALSFCFYGLPGTGKSAYARHLAARMGIDVVEKRASDLLSCWLGGTEKAIAAAFEEAADQRAMLILDEADSLLRDRGLAQHSWEVTQVNEMLVRMETAEHPFACTTNLMQSLDPATLRRFLFKVEFKAMNAAQGRAAFVRAFGLVSPPGLDGLQCLTPGDFAVVSRKAALLGERDPQRLLAMLEAEVVVKPGISRRRYGF